jgi:hypothetical protein
MAILENIQIPVIGLSEIIRVIGLILLGVIIGMGVSFFMKKISKSLIYPWIRKTSPESYKKTVSGVNFSSEIIKWIIIFLFIFQALSVFNIFLLEEILRLSIIFIPKLTIGFLIFIIGFIISAIISRKIRDLDFNRSSLVGNVFNIIFITATILSALEVIDVRLTAFLYMFAAGLLAIALGFAIAIGIAFGYALKPEITKIINNLNKAK